MNSKLFIGGVDAGGKQYLISRIQSLEAELATVRQERDEARATVVRWDGELAKAQAELRKAKGDHTDEERIEGLVTGAQVLKAANDRAGDLQKELDELQKEFVAMQERAHHAELRIARMVREGWADDEEG